MATAYQKGRSFENYVAKKLEGKYYVVRSAGSKGAFDLIAINNGSVYGIQCKKNNYIAADELRAMLSIARKYGIKPILATKLNNRGMFIDLAENKPAEL